MAKKKDDFDRLTDKFLPIKVSPSTLVVLTAIKKQCGLKNIDQVVRTLLWKAGIVKDTSLESLIDRATELNGGLK